MAFDHDTTWDQEHEQMVLEVIDGNPGACTIVCSLLSSPLWHPILQTLHSQSLVGSELWRVVHDDYHDDYGQFVQHLLKVSHN